MKIFITLLFCITATKLVVSADPPAKPPTDRPAKLPIDSPDKPPIDPPAKPPTDRPAKLPIDSPAEPPIDRPAEPLIDSPAKPQINPPAVPPIDPPGKPLTDAAIDPTKATEEKGRGTPSDDKDKAIKDVTAAIGEAKETAKTEEQKNALDKLLANIIKVILPTPPAKPPKVA